MKKILNNKKALVIIIIGIVLSGITYVTAKTLINSKDVIYTDTYDLGAENVQAAIDGTCSNIDKRLSIIENQLYTVTNISDTKTYVPTTDLTYTGISIPVPAKSYCSINVVIFHNQTPPRTIVLSASTNPAATLSFYSLDEGNYSQSLSTSYSGYFETAREIYVLSRAYSAATYNGISYSGFCATKYK